MKKRRGRKPRKKTPPTKHLVIVLERCDAVKNPGSQGGPSSSRLLPRVDVVDVMKDFAGTSRQHPSSSGVDGAKEACKDEESSVSKADGVGGLCATGDDALLVTEHHSDRPILGDEPSTQTCTGPGSVPETYSKSKQSALIGYDHTDGCIGETGVEESYVESGLVETGDGLTGETCVKDNSATEIDHLAETGFKDGLLPEMWTDGSVTEKDMDTGCLTETNLRDVLLAEARAEDDSVPETDMEAGYSAETGLEDDLYIEVATEDESLGEMYAETGCSAERGFGDGLFAETTTEDESVTETYVETGHSAETEFADGFLVETATEEESVGDACSGDMPLLLAEIGSLDDQPEQPDECSFNQLSLFDQISLLNIDGENRFVSRDAPLLVSSAVEEQYESFEPLDPHSSSFLSEYPSTSTFAELNNDVMLGDMMNRSSLPEEEELLGTSTSGVVSSDTVTEDGTECDKPDFALDGLDWNCEENWPLMELINMSQDGQMALNSSLDARDSNDEFTQKMRKEFVALSLRNSRQHKDQEVRKESSSETKKTTSDEKNLARTSKRSSNGVIKPGDKKPKVQSVQVNSKDIQSQNGKADVVPESSAVGDVAGKCNKLPMTDHGKATRHRQSVLQGGQTGDEGKPKISKNSSEAGSSSVTGSSCVSSNKRKRKLELPCEGKKKKPRLTSEDESSLDRTVSEENKLQKSNGAASDSGNASKILQNSVQSVKEKPVDKKKDRKLKEVNAEDKPKEVVAKDFGVKNPCRVDGCQLAAKPNSIFCGVDCLGQHVTESLKLIAQERSKSYNQNKSVSLQNTHKVAERIVVFERKTGKLITGPLAPTESSLLTWIQRHPTFEVLQPGQSVSQGSRNARERTLSSESRRRNSVSKFQQELNGTRKGTPEVSDVDSQKAAKKEEATSKSHLNKNKRVESASQRIESSRNSLRTKSQAELRRMLTARLEGEASASAVKVRCLASEIEAELWNMSNNSIEAYKKKFALIVQLFNRSSSQSLCRRLLNSEMQAKYLVLNVRRFSQSEPVCKNDRSDTSVNPLGILPGLSDTTEFHGKHVFDVSCRICTGKSEPGQASVAPVVTSSRPSNAERIANPPELGDKTSAEENLPVDETVQTAAKAVESDIPRIPASCSSSISFSHVRTNDECHSPVQWTNLPADLSHSECNSKQLLASEQPLSGNVVASSGTDELPAQSSDDVNADLQDQSFSLKPPSDIALSSLSPLEAPASHSHASNLSDLVPSSGEPTRVSQLRSDISDSTSVSEQSLTGSLLVESNLQAQSNAVRSADGVTKAPTMTTSFARRKAVRAAQHPPSDQTSQSTTSRYNATTSTTTISSSKDNIVTSPSSSSSSKLTSAAVSRMSQREVPMPSNKATLVDMVWRGNITAADGYTVPLCAYRTSGSMKVIRSVLPSTLTMMGRICPNTVIEYLDRIKGQHLGTREICVICFYCSNDQEKSKYSQLFSYLQERNRCGVIVNLASVIKDMYVWPLKADAPIPSILLPFTGPGLEVGRPNLLLGIVVQHSKLQDRSTHAKLPPQVVLPTSQHKLLPETAANAAQGSESCEKKSKSLTNDDSSDDVSEDDTDGLKEAIAEADPIVSMYSKVKRKDLTLSVVQGENKMDRPYDPFEEEYGVEKEAEAGKVASQQPTPNLDSSQTLLQTDHRNDPQSSKIANEHSKQVTANRQSDEDISGTGTAPQSDKNEHTHSEPETNLADLDLLIEISSTPESEKGATDTVIFQQHSQQDTHNTDADAQQETGGSVNLAKLPQPDSQNLKKNSKNDTRRVGRDKTTSSKRGTSDVAPAASKIAKTHSSSATSSSVTASVIETSAAILSEQSRDNILNEEILRSVLSRLMSDCGAKTVNEQQRILLRLVETIEVEKQRGSEAENLPGANGNEAVNTCSVEEAAHKVSETSGNGLTSATGNTKCGTEIGKRSRDSNAPSYVTQSVDRAKIGNSGTSQKESVSRDLVSMTKESGDSFPATYQTSENSTQWSRLPKDSRSRESSTDRQVLQNEREPVNGGQSRSGSVERATQQHTGSLLTAFGELQAKPQDVSTSVKNVNFEKILPLLSDSSVETLKSIVKSAKSQEPKADECTSVDSQSFSSGDRDGRLLSHQGYAQASPQFLLPRCDSGFISQANRPPFPSVDGRIARLSAPPKFSERCNTTSIYSSRFQSYASEPFFRPPVYSGDVYNNPRFLNSNRHPGDRHPPRLTPPPPPFPLQSRPRFWPGQPGTECMRMPYDRYSEDNSDMISRHPAHGMDILNRHAMDSGKQWFAVNQQPPANLARPPLSQKDEDLRQWHRPGKTGSVDEECFGRVTVSSGNSFEGLASSWSGQNAENDSYYSGLSSVQHETTNYLHPDAGESHGCFGYPANDFPENTYEVFGSISLQNDGEFLPFLGSVDTGDCLDNANNAKETDSELQKLSVSSLVKDEESTSDCEIIDIKEGSKSVAGDRLDEKHPENSMPNIIEMTNTVLENESEIARRTREVIGRLLTGTSTTSDECKTAPEGAVGTTADDLSGNLNVRENQFDSDTVDMRYLFPGKFETGREDASEKSVQKLKEFGDSEERSVTGLCEAGNTKEATSRRRSLSDYKNLLSRLQDSASLVDSLCKKRNMKTVSVNPYRSHSSDLRDQFETDVDDSVERRTVDYLAGRGKFESDDEVSHSGKESCKSESSAKFTDCVSGYSSDRQADIVGQRKTFGNDREKKRAKRSRSPDDRHPGDRDDVKRFRGDDCVEDGPFDDTCGYSSLRHPKDRGIRQSGSEACGSRDSPRYLASHKHSTVEAMRQGLGHSVASAASRDNRTTLSSSVVRRDRLAHGQNFEAFDQRSSPCSTTSDSDCVEIQTMTSAAVHNDTDLRDVRRPLIHQRDANQVARSDNEYVRKYDDCDVPSPREKIFPRCEYKSKRVQDWSEKDYFGRDREDKEKRRSYDARRKTRSRSPEALSGITEECSSSVTGTDRFLHSQPEFVGRFYDRSNDANRSFQNNATRCSRSEFANFVSRQMPCDAASSTQSDRMALKTDDDFECSESVRRTQEFREKRNGRRVCEKDESDLPQAPRSDDDLNFRELPRRQRNLDEDANRRNFKNSKRDMRSSHLPSGDVLSSAPAWAVGKKGEAVNPDQSKFRSKPSLTQSSGPPDSRRSAERDCVTEELEDGEIVEIVDTPQSNLGRPKGLLPSITKEFLALLNAPDRGPIDSLAPRPPLRNGWDRLKNT